MIEQEPPIEEECPFCGDIADPEILATARGWAVMCLDLECGAQGPLGHDKATAIRKWDDRTMSWR